MSFPQSAPYLGPTGSPDTFNQTSLDYPGAQGTTFNYRGKNYLLAQLSATANASAVNQLLYWKDPVAGVVTNKHSEAINGGTTHGWRNQVAGVLRNAATLGNYVMVLQSGKNISILSDGTGAAGDIIVAHTADTQVTSVAAANATYVAGSALQQLGTIRTAPSSGTLVADFSALAPA